MTKAAFPVPLGNLMCFLYQLKNILWAPVSQTVQPWWSCPSSTWLGKLHQERIQFEPTVQNVCLHPPCAWSPWHLITTMTNKFDHSQVNQTKQRTDLHLTVLKALVQGRIHVNIELSFSGAAERRCSVFPWCLFQSWGKKCRPWTQLNSHICISAWTLHWALKTTLSSNVWTTHIFTHCYSYDGWITRSRILLKAISWVIWLKLCPSWLSVLCSTH